MRDKLKLAFAAILAAGLCEGVVSPASAQSARGEPGVSADARALVRRAIASTGLILVRNSNDGPGRPPRPRGSAVVVRSDGVVATNNHVITNDKTNRVYDEILFSLSRDDAVSSGPRFRLKPLLINKEYDLALLSIDADASGNPLPPSFTFPSIEIGDSSKARLLEDLFIIGFPEKGGSTVTVNPGVIEGRDLLGNWLKTDARVIHGNSGGAAVNAEGKLIGIPTKVLADEQPVDKDGDGFPDDYRRYGAVGFLRPSNLVTEMLAKIENKRQLVVAAPAVVESSKLIIVRGVVKAADGGKPIAGVLVGLLPFGETNITENTLLTWGSTNADGEFKLNKPVPRGRYTLRAKALAGQSYTRDVEIGPESPALVIELSAAAVKE